jgi:hypothetical protein
VIQLPGVPLFPRMSTQMALYGEVVQKNSFSRNPYSYNFIRISCKM